MQKTCEVCGNSYEFTDHDEALFAKFGVRPLERCFECGQKSRLSFRNARSLYQRKCDATGADIISMYSPDKPYKVYKSDYWYSDAWDGLGYGQDFGFNRPFFEQFKELQLKVPRLALSNINAINSDYCNSSYGNKNCYLLFGGDNNEDCMFGTLSMQNSKSLDLDFSNHNELCYMLGDSFQCYNCRFAFDSKNCSDCAFISDCSGCSECILCTNLVNKSYCIQNQQYSKEEYFQKKAWLLNGSYTQQNHIFELFKALLKNRIVKYAHIVSSQDCTGDYIKTSKNCTLCFDVSESEDLRNIIFASKGKDCFNSSMIGDHSELIYETVSLYGSYNVRFSFFTIDSSNIEYSDFILNSQNCFGCVGLRGKQYCILNKQYMKEEYESLRAQIVEHMKKTGEWEEFFPHGFSCFAYNESTAHEYFPLSKEEALTQGFTWKEEEARVGQSLPHPLPDSIDEISDDILKEILLCEDCGKNYRIVAQELNFYRDRKLPIPYFCSDCRQKLRKSLRNPRKLWSRMCMACGVRVHSTYSPERSEQVYCEACYLKAVY